MNWFSKWMLMLAYNKKVAQQSLIRERVLPNLNTLKEKAEKKQDLLQRSPEYYETQIEVLSARTLPVLHVEIEQIKDKLKKGGHKFE